MSDTSAALSERTIGFQVDPFASGSSISINAVTWKQVEHGRPVGKHFRVAVVADTMNPKAVGKYARTFAFHVFMVDELDGTEDLVIEIIDDQVVPAAVPATNVIDHVAAHSTQDELKIPFAGKVSDADAPVIRCEPYLTTTRLQWAIAVNGEQMKGPRRLPRLFTLREAVQLVSETKATEMSLVISKQLRKSAKAKDFRTRSVNAALEKLGVKLKRWSKDNDLRYETLNKVISRGDHSPKERAAVMELTGLTEQKLWPE